ncbi:hypothetical protein, partial [Allosphingosinicella sp.]|uniref:hypothetical protein n=1 Tax=Allosphingosinicella sp. TaxID=2823234 RepID=UPI002F1F4FE9
MQLFRPEALRGRDRLHGEVMLVRPVSWPMLAAFFGAAALLGAAFLFTVEHRPSAPVSGRLVQDGARLDALFEVPTTIGAHAAPGQRIRVTVRDHPHETFQSVEARIVEVERAPGGGARSLVRATLAADSLQGSGSWHPLRPGLAVA